MLDDLLDLLGLDLRTFVLATGMAAVMVAAALTWPVSALVLWRYRRSVSAGMRRRAGGQPAPAPTPTPTEDAVAPAPAEDAAAPAAVGGPVAAAAASGRSTAALPTVSSHPASAPPRIVVVEVAAGVPSLILRARSSLGGTRAVLTVAGLIFGIGSTVAYSVVADLEFRPARTVSLVALLTWVLVPTLIATGITNRRTQSALWLGLLILTLGLPAAAGAGLVEGLQLFAIVVVIPGLVIALTSSRRIRGAAWLVFPTVAVLTVVALILYVPWAYLTAGVPLDRLAWGLIGVAAGLLALPVLYATSAAWLYTRKLVSDETLLVLQWWILLALSQAFLLGTQGFRDALGSFVPLALMLVFLLAVALLRRPPAVPPVRLLLLRTFGSRRRSSRLLRDLTTRWRWVGSVELISGADLATETLEPHEFLDYLSGRLRHRFIRDEGDLRRRLDGLDLRPDRDGRYRINELLCHEDTWRLALRALVGRTDAVLVDLRGLTPHHTGVQHEIDQLVALLPLDRVVAMTDATTDGVTLRHALDRAAAIAPENSPVRTDPAPALRVVPATGNRHRDVMALLNAVGEAASPVARESVVAAPLPPGI